MARSTPNGSDPAVMNEDNAELAGTAKGAERTPRTPLHDDNLEEPGVEQEQIQLGDRPQQANDQDTYEIDDADD